MEREIQREKGGRDHVSLHSGWKEIRFPRRCKAKQCQGHN